MTENYLFIPLVQILIGVKQSMKTSGMYCEYPKLILAIPQMTWSAQENNKHLLDTQTHLFIYFGLYMTIEIDTSIFASAMETMTEVEVYILLHSIMITNSKIPNRGKR